MSEQQQAMASAAGAAAGLTAAATVDRLARIETKLDGLREDREDLSSEIRGHATRLDRVERFMWLAVGMSFASGVPAVVRALGAAT